VPPLLPSAAPPYRILVADCPAQPLTLPSTTIIAIAAVSAQVCCMYDS